MVQQDVVARHHVEELRRLGQRRRHARLHRGVTQRLRHAQPVDIGQRAQIERQVEAVEAAGVEAQRGRQEQGALGIRRRVHLEAHHLGALARAHRLGDLLLDRLFLVGPVAQVGLADDLERESLDDLSFREELGAIGQPALEQGEAAQAALVRQPEHAVLAVLDREDGVFAGKAHEDVDALAHQPRRRLRRLAQDEADLRQPRPHLAVEALVAGVEVGVDADAFPVQGEQDVLEDGRLVRLLAQHVLADRASALEAVRPSGKRRCG